MKAVVLLLALTLAAGIHSLSLSFRKLVHTIHVVIFSSVKNDIFSTEFFDNFLNFGQNIDCGYTRF